MRGRGADVAWPIERAQGVGTSIEDSVRDLERDTIMIEVGVRIRTLCHADRKYAQVGAATDDARRGRREDGCPCVRTDFQPVDVPARAAPLVEVVYLAVYLKLLREHGPIEAVPEEKVFEKEFLCDCVPGAGDKTECLLEEVVL